jgi:hypothetical protein
MAEETHPASSAPALPLDTFGVVPASPHVSPVQARLTRVLMGLIMFVTGTYVGVDGARYYYHFSSPYSARAGYARTILCAILVWMTGAAHLDAPDSRTLKAAFAVTLVADYCLILQDWMIPGTVLFIVVHGLLIYRHARGFGDSLRPPERARSVRLYLLTALLVYGGAGGLIVGVRPILERTHMFALDAAYVLVLATSLWMALGTLVRRFYAVRNAWYIVIGMLCFFFCDVTVGLAAALKDTSPGDVLGNLVGFFYSPALVLLAFSGYAWHGGGAPRGRS